MTLALRRSPLAVALGLLTSCTAPGPMEASAGDDSGDEDDSESGDDEEGSSGEEESESEGGESESESSSSGSESEEGEASTTEDSTSTTASTSEESTVTEEEESSSESGTVEVCDEPPTCASANSVARCENGALVTEDCPNGTNCDGGTCNPVTCAGNLPAYNGNAGVTVYWFAQGTLTNPNDATQDVHCSFGSTRNWNGDDGGGGDEVYNILDSRLFGAIATADYNNAAACGSCVDLNYQGRMVRITVADECPVGSNPTCTNGHIDLSRQAFQTLTNTGTGDIGGVSWNVVPCGLTEPIAIELREPDNVYYKAFVVMKHEFPIARAQYQHKDGSWVDAVRDPANFFFTEEPNGNLTYRVRIHDVNGGIIEQELEGGVAGPQVGTHQFGCQ